MKSKLFLLIFFGVAAVEALAAVLWLGLMPAEAGNALAFGYSLQRLLLMGGLAAAGLFLLALALSGTRRPENIARFQKALSDRRVIILAGLILLIAWILAFSSAYQWGHSAGYKDRLLPVIIWLLLVGMQTGLLSIWLGRARRSTPLSGILLNEPRLVKAWGITLGVFVLVWLMIALFRIGLIPDIIYWNDFNVPLLGIQIIGIAVISIGLFTFLTRTGFFAGQTRSGFQRLLPDVVICLLIWGLAVIAWTQTGGPRSFFAPGPYPPNGEHYPFSDAAGYDTNAQFAAIGEGLGTRTYVDKPLYVAFLTLIHLAVGSRMDAVVGLQVAVIALLPVIMYLLGRRLHSRLAGLMAAGMIIFREINNINGTLWVLSANSQVLMSESLAGLLMAFSVLFFTAWVDKPDKKIWLMASGGALGLAGLTRLNPFLLLPVGLVVILLLMGRKWKRALIHAGLFFSFFAAAVLPWMLQSWIVHGNFIFFTSTVRWVVLPQRTYYALNPTPAQAEPESSPQEITQPGNETWNKITGMTRYVSAHFTHNVISAVTTFPVKLELDSLEQTIKSPGSFWSAEWKGDLPPGEIGLLWINLAIISLGLAAGWARHQWAGLVPAGFFLAYSLATAGARTSGGRYILPADWVGMFYFALGLSQVYVWLSTWLAGAQTASFSVLREEVKPIRSGGFQAAILLGLFLVIGGTPVILDRVIPRRYVPVEKASLADDRVNSDLLSALQISKADLQAFLNTPGAVVYRGRGLYPRFYGINKGEPDQYSAARGLPYSRLVLTLIGPQIQTNGILPTMKLPEYLPNGADVLAIGCTGELNDDWFALVIEGPHRQIYLRSPATEWVCPAKAPVCDDNRNCQ